jgi:ATP-dependent DNA helicase RecG
MFDLNTPVENLFLIGPARAKLLKKLEVYTLKDLLFYFPRYHQDLSRFTLVSDIKPGDFANCKARVLSVKNFRTKIRKLNITQALIEDSTDSIICVWFNQPFLSKIIKTGEEFVFSGKVVYSGGKRQLQNPVYEQVKAEQVHTARLVPVYSLTANLTQKQLRSIIKNYLDKISIPEYLPLSIIKEERLLDENAAVKTFHFPNDHKLLFLAQKRLAFDEIFQTQIRVLKYKKQRKQKKAEVIPTTPKLEEKIKKLPFILTDSQIKALQDILNDLGRPHPANRLLEGDVGSGKTIVAALAMHQAACAGVQSALLSPTEVLSQQHYLSLLDFFKNDGINVGLLTSSSVKFNGNPVTKATMVGKISNGTVQVVIGTHALLQPSIKFKKLAMVVIDEQHRFGVEQRSALRRVDNAHLLSMTATPIPRTLALTMYGDLDITRLEELPKGRLPIKTVLVSEQNRKNTYSFIASEINSGRQAFVVCPLIEESDKLGVKSVLQEHEKLATKVFPQFSVGLLHGKLKSDEKEEVMRKFKDNQIQILVSTSVVEVGVDVPNATIMIIEGAERFGLAQLHQFRGRVGRSTYQSHCFLFSDSEQQEYNPRLKAVVESSNGFTLAEKDLEIRGSGDLYGTKQSGYGFKIATLSNLPAVERSKKYAEKILETDLEMQKSPRLKEIIDQKPIIHFE